MKHCTWNKRREKDKIWRRTYVTGKPKIFIICLFTEKILAADHTTTTLPPCSPLLSPAFLHLTSHKISSWSSLTIAHDCISSLSIYLDDPLSTLDSQLSDDLVHSFNKTCSGHALEYVTTNSGAPSVVSQPSPPTHSHFLPNFNEIWNFIWNMWDLKFSLIIATFHFSSLLSYNSFSSSPEICSMASQRDPSLVHTISSLDSLLVCYNPVPKTSILLPAVHTYHCRETWVMKAKKHAKISHFNQANSTSPLNGFQ